MGRWLWIGLGALTACQIELSLNDSGPPRPPYLNPKLVYEGEDDHRRDFRVEHARVYESADGTVMWKVQIRSLRPRAITCRYVVKFLDQDGLVLLPDRSKTGESTLESGGVLTLEEPAYSARVRYVAVLFPE